MTDEPIVSVLVICYNHENYIRQCLDNILSQKTEYPFEILVHDDASTDNSANIIREYESDHPDIIKAIYQTENQYSKKVPIFRDMVRRAKGRFVIICESDDYWCDDDKLQIQTEYMLKNPDCTMCCHSSNCYSEREKKLLDIHMIRPGKSDRDITTEEIIEFGGGFIATSTMLYKKEYGANRPDYCMCHGVSDYPMMIFLSANGRVHYIDKCMTIYRAHRPGSWTESVNDPQKRIRHLTEMNKMLREADEYHGFKYHKSVEERIKHNDFDIALLSDNWDEMLKRKYAKFFKEVFTESRLKLKTKMKLRKLLKKQ